MSVEKEVFLITGASGLLGHALSHHFGSKNHRIVGLDREGPPNPPPNVECLYCDLTSDESVQKTMFMVQQKYGGKIKSVFHLAAYYSFSGEDSHLYEDLTVKGTERLLRELKNFEVGQFIFSSSMLVYKPGPKGVKLAETAEVYPTWGYPASKVETEKLVLDKHGKVPVVILRIAGVYTNVCLSIPLAHQIQRIYEHRLEGHLYSGNVDVKQSFVHLADVVRAFELCVEKADQLSEFEVFNIGEEDALTYDETQRTIARFLFDEPWATLDVPKPIAKAGAWVEEKIPLMEKPFIRPWMIDRADDNYELDTSKARQILGWQPEFSMAETLPVMLEGLKIDPQKWYHLNKLHYSGSQEQKTLITQNPEQPVVTAGYDRNKALYPSAGNSNQRLAAANAQYVEVVGPSDVESRLVSNQNVANQVSNPPILNQVDLNPTVPNQALSASEPAVMPMAMTDTGEALVAPEVQSANKAAVEAALGADGSIPAMPTAEVQPDTDLPSLPPANQPRKSA